MWRLAVNGFVWDFVLRSNVFGITAMSSEGDFGANIVSRKSRTQVFSGRRSGSDGGKLFTTVVQIFFFAIQILYW